MKNSKPVDQYLIPEEMEQQEHLSLERLNKLYVVNLLEPKSIRPPANFIDLMNWVLLEFGNTLKDQVRLNKLVHNRIIIDGPFLQFCEERKVKVECLFQDSTISWKTDHNYEKFFVQGVFKIKTKETEFLHAALFAKGGHNEDEINFFVICSEGNYSEYVKFRNEFDEWVAARDRSNLHVRVIEGDDIVYTKEHTWEDLFLPADIKNDIKGLVESFLSSKDFYLQKKIPWKRGVLLWGKPGCHAKGTPIMMFDGSWKNVEDVAVGDKLMGPDSQPRNVLELVRDRADMFRITPNKGDPFIVNGEHIMHLVYSSKQRNFPAFTNMTVNQYLKLSQSLREKLKLVKSPRLEFEAKEELELDPYLLGVWLGDGTTGKPEITSADPEIIQYCKDYAHKYGMNCSITKSGKSKAKKIYFSHIGDDINHFTYALRKLGIFEDKKIPQKYLTASVEDRLKLMAGIIDTDGAYNTYSWRASEKYKKKGHKGCFDLIQVRYQLLKQVQYLCLSLGLGSTVKQCTKSIKSRGFTGTYWRMGIYGDIGYIPTLLPRKQALKIPCQKNCRHVGFRSIENIGEDDYYGFVVNKDHLYVMDNFWVAHNCGKSSIIKTIMSVYPFKPITIASGSNDEAMNEAFSYAQEQSPSLLYFEDLDSMLDRTIDTSTFLNLMDGISTKNGMLIIATANDVKKLKPNITDRPSRFDRKFEIPLPNHNMAYLYLRKWFGNVISVKKAKELAKYGVKYGFSYSHFKECYISAMFEALAHNRKTPTEKDVDHALLRIIKDKSMLHNGQINMDKYLQ